jgi:hypothetical protein
MVAWLGTLSPVADTGGAVPMSPQLLQDMRAHGYFGAGQ